MSFSETIFLFFLALIIFGPKKLPEMARQAGKLLAELRRASNEFRSQIETEIAHLEVEKKQSTLPAVQPPPGAVPSASLAQATNAPVDKQPDAATTLDAPIASSAPTNGNAEVSSPASSAPTEAASESSAPTSQESHV